MLRGCCYAPKTNEDTPRIDSDLPHTFYEGGGVKVDSLISAKR